MCVCVCVCVCLSIIYDGLISNFTHEYNDMRCNEARIHTSNNSSLFGKLAFPSGNPPVDSMQGTELGAIAEQ